MPKKRVFIFAAIAWTLLSLAISAFDWQDRWHAQVAEPKYFLKLWIYWLQWGLMPFCVFFALSGLAAWRKKIGVQTIGYFCATTLLLLVVWMGQIEPNLLQVREQEIPIPAKSPQVRPIKLAVLSDLHWGIFVRDYQIRRTVEKLKEINADAVLIAGDLTYEPKKDLAKGFSAFAELKMPVFMVLGNHDVEKPGPKIQNELRSALRSLGLHVIEGEQRQLLGWRIIGLDDLWGGQPEEQIKKFFSVNMAEVSPTLVLTHQPDTIALLPTASIALAVAGHTHGGQIDIPALTPKVLQRTMKTNWYNGLYQTPAGSIWVTTGTGMSGLPFRFRIPPRIDVLTLRPQLN